MKRYIIRFPFAPLSHPNNWTVRLVALVDAHAIARRRRTMINDVASKEREREKSFGDGTKRTKWETIEKKWERERDLGPLLAIQLHHVISRRWDLILVGDMVKIDGFSRSPQSVDILSLSFQLASTPTAAAAEAKGASTIRLIENATINRSFSMTAHHVLLLPTWRNIYQRGIVFVEATSVVFSPSKTKTWPRAGRLRSANRLADGAMMASVNHHELARLHPRFKMGRTSFWARHAIIGLIPLSSSVPTAHAYYLGLITYIRSLGEFFFFLFSAHVKRLPRLTGQWRWRPSPRLRRAGRDWFDEKIETIIRNLDSVWSNMYSVTDPQKE